MKKIFSLLIGVATVLSPLAFTTSALATAPLWDTTGDYEVAIEYQGTDYPHDVTLAQDAAGNLTGNGTSVAGGNTYTWVITSGEVDGDDISFTADYTATQDAVTPQAVMEVEGTIAQDGTLSGTWSDNYDGGNRWGNWNSTAGEALAMTTEPPVADADSDGYISVAEGVPFYGGIVNSLTTSGGTTADSALALGRFPVANSNGDYTYIRTFTLSDDVTDLADVHIVVHGADINENGMYDGEKESSIAPGVPFEATVPVACGVAYKTQANMYKAELNQLNSTGVTGDVMMQKIGSQVMVTMTVENASPNLAHAQHFHLGGTNECPPNTVGVMQDMENEPLVADVDNDGYVSGAEGVPFYGAVVNSFTTSGDTTADSALALGRFPVADDYGDYTYDRTFTLADEITDLEEVAIVVHGADINENGMYDGAKRSTLDPTLPFEGTVPVACGIVYKSGTNMYTADLSQLNSTGVTGDATIQKNGNEVTVSMTVENASPNLAHAQHFHLGGTNECPPNTVGVLQETGDGSPTGDIGGDVVGDEVMLAVTSIDMIDTTATANGSFASGWEYVFHITAPMDEQDLAMKFTDWLQTNGNGTFSVANNMRISSAQADNGGATILLTAENTYSTPALRMTEDLDLGLDGRQVEITVEVAVPNGTPNGAYTTSYGVRSL